MTHYQPNADMGPSYWEYIERFDYRLTVKLGKTYTPEFKEFSAWCENRLGTKYKDWFLTSNSKGHYTLFCKSNKWSTFLALTWVDKIVA